MTVANLKENLHRMIDQIDNPMLLKDYYSEMKHFLDGSTGSWVSLTSEQQNEVLLALKESENPEELIDNEKVFAQYRKNELTD